ncbi:MAG: cytidine deaminase [Bacteroidaceae bacterium]|nr:cytidine deaminase [Bacteroidaceae bacterium]
MKQFSVEIPIVLYKLDELDEADRKLVEQACDATRNSYSPYSKFRVGAALKLADGQVFLGSNQENASFPVGSCAERTAFFAASAAAPDVAPTAIAIAAWTDGQFTENPVSPCGMCRQALLEAETRFGQPLRVLLYGKSGVYVVRSVGDLLPLTFTGEQLCVR